MLPHGLLEMTSNRIFYLSCSSRSVTPSALAFISSRRLFQTSSAVKSGLADVAPTKRYSKTLNLPYTPLSSWSDVVKQEQEYSQVTTSKLYNYQRKHNTGPEFVFLDGPPYANGHLHMGHAMNKILKDVINRYIPGWDCHGLPIETKAVEQLNVDNLESLSPSKVRETAKSIADKWVKIQTAEFKAFGIMADFTQIYRTKDHDYTLRQLRLFAKLHEKGVITRRFRPVYYSPSSKTALAESELVYVDDFVSHSVYVRFPIEQMSTGLKKIVDSVKREKDEKIAMAVWTTTAWSLPSNMAIAVNSEIEYSIIRRSDDTNEGLLIAASERLDSLKGVIGDFQVLATLMGSAIVSTTYTHPFLNTKAEPKLPEVLHWSLVTPSSGTGIVHIAPGAGFEDYDLFRSTYPDILSSNLRSPINDSGRYTEAVLEYSREGKDLGARLVGKEVLGNGRGEVIKLLREEGVLLAEKRYQHRYPTDWKTKKPVICRNTSQWFANLDGVKEKALKALENVTFVPPNSRNRLVSFIQSRSEWCISRQRAWGVPIPALIDVSTGEAIMTTESLDHILGVLDKKGVSYWWEGPASEFVPESLRSSGREFTKGRDTMDVWFDSGTAWTSLVDGTTKPTNTPLADVILEGSDQHRGWFQSLLLTYVAVSDAANPCSPFATVITHGFALDEKEAKMSKSDGNVISPVEMVQGVPLSKNKRSKAYGTDSLRVWAATGDFTSDVAIGPDALSDAAKLKAKFRNTMRFMLACTSAEEEVGLPPVTREDMSLLDRYILHELYIFEKSVREAYDSYALNRVVSLMNEFCTRISALYIASVKDTLYADILALQSRRAVVDVLRSMLHILLQTLAPIAPYTSEEIFYHMKDRDVELPSLFGSGWIEASPIWYDMDSKNDMEVLLIVKSQVDSLLSKSIEERYAKTAQDAHLEIIIDNSEVTQVLQKHSSILPMLFRTSNVTIVFTPSDDEKAWQFEKSVQLKGNEAVTLRIFPSLLAKCPRCWLHISRNEESLCVRCAAALDGVNIDLV